MIASGKVTEGLAEWLCSTSYDDLPLEARGKALDVVFDSVGGMMACSVLPEVRSIVEFIKELGGEAHSTIIGQTGRVPVVSAAMANGAMAHGAEVDPVHLTSVGGHVAAGPVPSALSVGQWVEASGRDILRAVVLGYEVGGRLMTIFYRERDYLTRRFYHTAVAGALSSAVTAALLLGLDRLGMQVALGLAAYHILDGPRSLFDAFLETPDAGAEMMKDLGRYYAITDVMHKRYPAGSPNQTYLQGIFRLLHEHGIGPEEIHQVEIQIPQRGVHRIPTTRHAAISGEMVCAMALAQGKLDFYQLHDQATVASPQVQRMRDRVHFVGREDWKGMEQGRHAIVSLTTTKGQKLEEEIWHEPMTQQELKHKFHSLVTPRLGEEKTRRVESLLKGLERAESIKPLMEELEG